MSKKSNILRPLTVRKLSSRQMLDEINTKTTNKNIKSVRFISPKIGKKGYGHFEVSYKVPQLMAD